MRDKGAPGDTYNHKEHVYADPVALRQEIEREKQENEAGKAMGTQPAEGRGKKYRPASAAAADPPAVPTGPRRSVSSGLYAEIQKKSNVPSQPRTGVRDLGSLFGGTVQRRAGGGESSPPVSPPAPPVPAVTEARNALDDSPPATPGHPPPSSDLGALAPNITSAEEPGMTTEEREGEEAVTGGRLSSHRAGETRPADSEGKESNGADQAGGECPAVTDGGSPPVDLLRCSPSPVDETEVVIDVRINSDAGVEIGAEIPVAVSEASDTGDGGGHQGDGGGVRLVRSIRHDPFAVEDSGRGTSGGSGTSEVEAIRAAADAVPAGNASKVEGAPSASTAAAVSAVSAASSDQGSGSAGSGSVKRPKKDVESGMNSGGHLRRNLILLSLFLLILLILLGVVAVVLVNYSDILG